MDISTRNMSTVAKSTYSILYKAYKSRQQERLKEFLRCIDLRYTSMTTEDKTELNRKINTEDGQELLAEYADTITKTSSNRARMAIALLYCDDTEFSFDESEKITFISAMNGINDDFIDFFIKVTELPVQEKNSPYPRAAIHNQTINNFGGGKWDEEAVFVYTNDLIRVRLLLPDPKAHGTVYGDGKGWAVWFGVTNRSKKFAAILRKAGSLLNET